MPCVKAARSELLQNAMREEEQFYGLKTVNETCAINVVYILPDSTSDKNRKYLPFWEKL